MASAGPVVRGACTGLLAAVLLVCGPAGCVSESVEARVPLVRSTLTVVRAGEEVQLSWSASAGHLYTVLYSDQRDPRSPWQALPGAINLRGEGKDITVRDQVPEGRNRYYRLHLGNFPTARLP